MGLKGVGRKRAKQNSWDGSASLVVRVLLCALLAATMTFAVGCRDTDALKEIVYDQNSKNVDVNNPNKFYINDSQSEIESQAVASSEVCDEDPTSPIIQNLIIYSSNPNNHEYVAKQSKFSANPSFKGIEASSSVFFYRSNSVDALDRPVTAENLEDPIEDEQEEEKDKGDNQSYSNSQSTVVGTSGLGGTTAGKAEEDNQGGSKGDTPTPGEFDPSQGFGGNEKSGGFQNPTVSFDAFDPNKSAEDYPASSFAAFGEYAVMVQMLGGSGALVATDFETLKGFAAAGISDAGSDPANGQLGSIAIGWNDKGTAKWLNVDAIIAAFREKDPEGLAHKTCYIIAEDSAASYFGEYGDALEKLEAAGIRWVNLRPMDNTEDIKKNVAYLGTMISASAIAQYGANAAGSDNSAARANYYVTLHDEKVAAASDGLARDVVGEDKVLQTGNDRIDYGSSTTTTLLVNAWDDSASFAGYPFDRGIAFSKLGYSTTPVSYYMQAGGVINNAAVVASGTTTGSLAVTQFSLLTLSPLSSSLSADSAITLTQATQVARALLDSGKSPNAVGVGKGLGTEDFPAVVVTSGEIRDLMIRSSASAKSLYHPFGWVTSFNVSAAGANMGGSVPFWSSVGAGDGRMNDKNPNNPLGDSLSTSQIYVNPNGIFCDWTEGSVESFLEAGWVSSQFGKGYGYEQWKQDVRDFYSWAYGVSVNINTITNR